MRKQYSFWSGEDGFNAWDADRLVEMTSDYPVVEVDLDSIWEVDTVYWFDGDPTRATVRSVADHARLINAVDLSYPIILSAGERVMDGMHRIARALLEGRTSILARRSDVDPEPEFRGCRPEDLPYD